MAKLPLETHHAIDVAIDQAGGKAQASMQWLLEKDIDEDAKPTEGNHLQFFVCGEEGFRQIATDLINAKGTVDICCWGFDPGMELWRGSESPAGVGVPKLKGNPAPGAWPRGIVYGALLEEITQRQENPVTVRLLIWFDGRGSRKQNSMPGFTDVSDSISYIGSAAQKSLMQKAPYSDEERTQWCIDWWQRNLPDGEERKSGILTTNQQLRIVLRSISSKDVQSLMQAAPKEEDAPSTDRAFGDAYYVNEKSLLEDYATHHQKPILIDYASPDNGRNAVGYVMGLNSITDYWDKTAHEIDDPLREKWAKSYVKAELKHERETQGPDGALSTAPYKHVNPYQDYACRMVGKALKRLHQNFERGWNLFAPAAWQTKELTELPSGIPSLPDNPAYKVQIVRTQPNEGEKTIKSLYFQASSIARRYIYIENQYFFYPEFARNLKQERQKFHDAWADLSNKPIKDAPMLHLFVVTPHPQDDGMIPRTYDMMAELGHGDAWKAQAELSSAGKTKETYTNKDGENTFHPQSLQDLQSGIGLNVSIARLRTSGTVGNQMAYREIYIHSKLMIIDDVFVTLGSANMNQRSMSVDSEINFGATGLEWASTLRERIFSLLSGGATSGSGDWEEMPDVFDRWEKRMQANLASMIQGKDMQGFILPFMDRRSTTTLHASIDAPWSTFSNTA